MLPAIVIERLPRLVRAIKLLPEQANADEAIGLADELSGVTAMVSEKFTNDRTAEGIQRALMLTVGGISLGLEHLLAEEGDDSDAGALDILIDEGAEYVFQAGFRLVRELSALPEDSLVGEYDLDPVYSQRRLKELFVDLCTADPGESWTGYERYQGQLRQRLDVQAIVNAAKWLRKHHYEGPVKDPDINAEGVIAMAIIFAVDGGGVIVARAGQKAFENFVKSVRKNQPDFEAGWAALLEKVPAPHRAIIAERIASYRDTCSVLKNIHTKAPMKQLVAEMENYAGSELDTEYP
ncbi:hypothetical protein G4G28_06985 [Massilia sp. Dwa41.01b]|uniref:hypothetical protein n=1 Tax=unclassified Massilia TaxID=2609279 RepID=UPI0015FEB931|nr:MULTISPECIES: hypothetical protein [unclassified Massilia]QNA90991.1 hypothetical protein G4G28_06985 [Massilia sp. Dwa41.01b]QNB01377.1 hypothetical protein G4G31_10695 [Massilia sp. Se16.2.3]